MPLQVFLFLMAGCWVFSPAGRGDWVWDDPVEVPQNAVLRDPAGLSKIWSGSTGLDYLPFKTTVQWVAWRLWEGQTAGYHRLNAGLHLVSAFLFWHLLKKLGVAPAGAWLGGFLFVVHPLAVESVAWISELKNTLSLPLLLLALWAWMSWNGEKGGAAGPSDAYGLDSSYGPHGGAGTRLRPASPGGARRPTSELNSGLRSLPRRSVAETGHPSTFWYTLSLALFVLAMLSKGSVVMFPGVLLLYCWWKRGRVARSDLLASLPFFIVSLVLGLVTLCFQAHRAIGGTPGEAPGMASRLAAAGLSIAFYCGKCLFPFGLEPIYPPWSVNPPALWQFWPWVVIVGVMGVLIYNCERAQNTETEVGRRRDAPPHLSSNLLFGVGFFLLNLLPVLGFLPMSYLRISPVSDHFAYISLLGILGLVAAGFGWSYSSLGKGGRLLAATFAAAVVAALAAQARSYDKVFRNDETLWTYALERNPDAWLAHNNLGKVLFASGRLGEAGSQFERAATLNPADAESHFNRGLVLADSGRPQEAVAEYRSALRLKPAFPEAEDCLGNSLLNLGRPAEAVDCYRKALRLEPDFPEAHANLGVALATLGQLPEAELEFETALRLRPGYPEAEQNLERLRASR